MIIYLIRNKDSNVVSVATRNKHDAYSFCERYQDMGVEVQEIELFGKK